MKIGILGLSVEQESEQGKAFWVNQEAARGTMIRRAFYSRLSAALLLGVAGTASLYAHAILVNSQPATNAKVKGPSIPIVLTFNSRIDQSRSTLTLESPKTASLRIKKDAPSPEKLLGELLDASPGDYNIGWQVLSVDGHITRGQIGFEVL